MEARRRQKNVHTVTGTGKKACLDAGKKNIQQGGNEKYTQAHAQIQAGEKAVRTYKQPFKRRPPHLSIYSEKHDKFLLCSVFVYLRYYHSVYRK